jgi:hypothetical protein
MNNIFCKNVALFFDRDTLHTFLEQEVNQIHDRVEDISDTMGLFILSMIDFSESLGVCNGYY